MICRTRQETWRWDHRWLNMNAEGQKRTCQIGRWGQMVPSYRVMPIYCLATIGSLCEVWNQATFQHRNMLRVADAAPFSLHLYFAHKWYILVHNTYDAVNFMCPNSGQTKSAVWTRCMLKLLRPVCLPSIPGGSTRKPASEKRAKIFIFRASRSSILA